ncbi:MAG: UDP-phosphate galactose phosphotransferase [Micavibrio sp.]|nr:UDP-phosphate galactose phosphotransferase [Micavibrio sp.]
MVRDHATAGQLAKLLMDKCAAAAGLLVLSPVFLFVAYKIRKDGGPAFFGHTRLGQGGKTFKCWKFRSMDINSAQILKDLLARDPAARAEWEKDFKLRNDPRITKIGHFIRKTSIDELPQLFNVLRGEMSLVGPRPIVSDEIHYYGDHIADYYAVKPGITGLWQVSGRNDVSYEERVELDTRYVRHWSFWNDISILFKTVGVIACRKGAY